MAKKVNKVVVNGTTKLDLTGDDVTEADVVSGKKFHKADGSQGTGTASFPTLPLSVGNGGTGKSTLTENSILAGDGTNAVKNISSASGALYSTASGGAPKFGTLPVAQGGTGSSYSDFSTLCDAVGSGGNWIDVSTKFQNAIHTYDSNFVIDSVVAYVYENMFMNVAVVAHCNLALNAYSNFYKAFTLDDWVAPKVGIEVPSKYAISNLSDALMFIPITNIPAGTKGLGIGVSYLLKTPYDPS